MARFRMTTAGRFADAPSGVAAGAAAHVIAITERNAIAS
jgi:hypothetical protein